MTSDKENELIELKDKLQCYEQNLRIKGRKLTKQEINAEKEKLQAQIEKLSYEVSDEKIERLKDVFKTYHRTYMNWDPSNYYIDSALIETNDNRISNPLASLTYFPETDEFKFTQCSILGKNDWWQKDWVETIDSLNCICHYTLDRIIKNIRETFERQRILGIFELAFKEKDTECQYIIKKLLEEFINSRRRKLSSGCKDEEEEFIVLTNQELCDNLHKYYKAYADIEIHDCNDANAHYFFHRQGDKVTVCKIKFTYNSTGWTVGDEVTEHVIKYILQEVYLHYKFEEEAKRIINERNLNF